MNPREFRFGAAVGLVPSAKALHATAERIEQLGYSTMLVADGLWLPAPFSALSAAAAVTSTLRIGTCVLATPLRPPAAVAHETETIDLLSDHRFELGLGTGRPQGTAADAERLGIPFGTRAERVAHVAATVAAVKQQFVTKDQRVPKIMIGGIGRTLVELAVAEADILTLPVPYDRPEADLVAKVGELRAVAGGRFDELELTINVLAVGDKELPAWVPPTFRDLPADSYGRLGGKPTEIADTLRRRRDRAGISYVTVPQWAVEDFAPVVELLTGT